MANENGSYFESQGPDLNPFEVLSLPAHYRQLTPRGVRWHCRQYVMKHVVERRGPDSAPTRGPRVPTWSHTNRAKDALLADLDAEMTKWARIGVCHTWNPREAVGSPAALIPWSPTVLPAEYFQPEVDEVIDELMTDPPPGPFMGPSIRGDPMDITRDDECPPACSHGRQSPPTPPAGSRRHSLPPFNPFGHKTSPAVPSPDDFVHFRAAGVASSTDGGSSITAASSRLPLSGGGVLPSARAIHNIRSDNGDGEREDVEMLGETFSGFGFE